MIKSVHSKSVYDIMLLAHGSRTGGMGDLCGTFHAMGAAGELG